MSASDQNEIRERWNRLAADWDRQVGDEGDDNRRLNSDPVLWQLAGDVAGLRVLDAGCGTGYLSRQLRERGALVIGVDVAEEMIAIARGKSPDLDYRVDSCCELQSLEAESFDLVLANYVLMDLPDLEAAVTAFYRVLKPGGAAVVIFSHPCFPQGDAEDADSPRRISYYWEFNYFEPQRRVDPPWGHFQDDFVWFHRPLSYYWKVFQSAGFRVSDFEEPRITPDRYHLAPDQRCLDNDRTRPYSVAFRLVKKNATAEKE